MSDPIVGIDLGTSNTAVAYADATGQVRVLADESGFKIHPSVVSFHPSGGVVVGAAAKQRKVIDPRNTIYSAKRLIGRSFDSPEVRTALQRMPYEIKQGANQQPMVVTRGGEFAIPEISAIVLDHVRHVGSGQLQTEVNRAVVTVPASFNDAQRSATATAGSIAGLSVVRVLNEPTAAALAYGHARNLRETIAVYDFGGGTFDITILRLEDQVFEVLGTAGNSFLGGDDLDERLVDRMVDKFLAEHRLDLRNNEVSMMRLRAVAEQTKIELTRRSRAIVRVDEIAYGPNGKPLDLQIEITRDEFVAQVADIIDRTFPVCEEAMTVAQLDSSLIDDVILVGGTTKIPYVRDQVSRFFSKAPRTDVNPEDAVAIGAALQATSLERVLNRPSPARASAAVPRAASQDTFTETTVPGAGPSLDDTGTTLPAAEAPLPPEADDVDELVLSEPRPQSGGAPHGGPRQTAAYPQVGRRPQSEPRVTERPVERGQAIDRFEERTTTTGGPSGKALGRLRPTAKSGQIGAIPREVERAESRPVRTPPPVPRTTERTPVVRPPAPPQIPAVPPVPAAVPQIPPVAPRAAAPPQVVPAPPATPPQVPAASPLSATMLFEPEPWPPPMDGPTEPGPGGTDLDFPPIPTVRDLGEPSPASTAKGFVAPQSYPVLSPQVAAAQAMVVMDVTPRGLGIGTVAGFCEELIRRNSRVPTEIRKLFTTSRDHQDTVRIVVVQGESRRLDRNVVIGDLKLEHLPPRPRGETSIEVTFMIDASGILQVRARDAQTGKEQRATLDVIGTMPEADVEASRDRLASLRR